MKAGKIIGNLNIKNNIMIYVVLIISIILGVYFSLKDKFKDDGSFIDAMNKSIHARTIIMTVGAVVILIILLFRDCSG